MEAIEGIKIIQVEGLGNNGHGTSSDGNGGGNLADNVVNSALRYRAQAPLVDSLLKDIGLEGGDINGLAKALGAGDSAGGPDKAVPKAKAQA